MWGRILRTDGPGHSHHLRNHLLCQQLVSHDDDNDEDQLPEGDNKAVVDVNKGKAEQVVKPEDQSGGGGVDVDGDIGGGDGGDSVDVNGDVGGDGDVESEAEQVVRPEHKSENQKRIMMVKKRMIRT